MAKEPKDKAPPDEEIEEVIRNVADRLAAARKARGLTQSALAEMADISQQRIFELEQGTANVTIRTLARIAKVLGVDLRLLFTKLGPASENPLLEAMWHITDLLEERDSKDQSGLEQERVFRANITELLEQVKVSAVRNPTGKDEGQCS